MTKKIDVSEAARILRAIKTKKRAMASRLNGAKPCRPGKRRGRPIGSTKQGGIDGK